MRHFFVFDVESIGLHGEGFAVGGGVWDEFGRLEPETDFLYSCEPWRAYGQESDRQWVKANVPELPVTHEGPKYVRAAFWKRWREMVAIFPEITMAAECAWPVEAYFLRLCVFDSPEERTLEGPYPLHDIATFMAAAGMDPMHTYMRKSDEKPRHNPLSDALQSARLLAVALEKIHTKGAA